MLRRRNQGNIFYDEDTAIFNLFSFYSCLFYSTMTNWFGIVAIDLSATSVPQLCEAHLNNWQHLPPGRLYSWLSVFHCLIHSLS